MFTFSELLEVVSAPEFQYDLELIRQLQVEHRMGQYGLMPASTSSRLSYFVQAVMASAPQWQSEEPTITKLGAEIAELLAEDPALTVGARARCRLHSAMLYELSDLPAVAQTLLKEKDLPPLLTELFQRRGAFEHLLTEPVVTSSEVAKAGAVELLVRDALALALYEQGAATEFVPHAVWILWDLAADLSIGLSQTELRAFEAVVQKRATLATRAKVPDPYLFDQLRRTGFPAELWAIQSEAIDGGLLSERYDSWGLASPTGTGKTFLTRLLILDALLKHKGGQVIYLVPSRALVYEVTRKLSENFKPLGIEVVAVTPQLVKLEGEEEKLFASASVVVLTPEKADLLLRLGADLFRRLKLVVVDEAHHIESGARGILLELYLWRIRRMIGSSARFIFLSAVAPNIRDLVSWIGRNPYAVSSHHRATRMRVGTYKVVLNGLREGWLEFTDHSRIKISENVPADNRDALIELASVLKAAGPVLVIARSRRECEVLADAARKWLTLHEKLVHLRPEELTSEPIQRLDSRLEREMYTEVPLREHIRDRVAYHHAGLPPRVRSATEDAIRDGLIDYVFATTTLAEGVNFPFATVIVQSLAVKTPPAEGRPSRYEPVTPRTFWNIAGRAGRPGYDKEGQVVLFTPTLALDKANATIDSYLNNELRITDPVKSGLAEGLARVAQDVASGAVDPDAIRTIKISPRLPEQVVSTLNLVRVGLVHARATGLIQEPSELLDGTFAGATMDDDGKASASEILRIQGDVVQEFLGADGAPPIELVAELGLSLETLADLRDFVRSRDTWQLEAMNNVMWGGVINDNQLKFIVQPTASRMAELGGRRLGGGVLGRVVEQWISGVPFTTIRTKTGEAGNRLKRLEDYVNLIYTKVQYLLPWGLYAMDRLVAEEATRRNIVYGHQIQTLAYLADAGVPDLDSLRLVGFDFERVDATRLSEIYRQRHLRERGVDIVGWLIREPLDDISRYVQHPDARRVDYDLAALIEKLRVQPRRL